MNQDGYVEFEREVFLKILDKAFDTTHSSEHMVDSAMKSFIEWRKRFFQSYQVEN